MTDTYNSLTNKRHHEMKTNGFWLHTEGEYQDILRGLKVLNAMNEEREQKSLIRQLDGVDRRLNGDRRQTEGQDA